MPSETFALAARTDPPGKVRIWCEQTSKRGGIVKFFALNGGWGGTFKDNLIQVDGASDWANVAVVWRGVVPPPHSRDYNAAIAWIEEQIGN